MALAAVALVSTACGEESPPDVQDWLREAVGDAPVIEHDYAPRRERGSRIELLPDVVIRERPEDTRYAFGRERPTVAVDAAGRFFVYDASNHRVAVFDAAGEFSHQFGGFGQGPGEFDRQENSAIGFQDERFFAWSRFRLRFWNPDGTFVDGQYHDTLYSYWFRPSQVVPVAGGAFITSRLGQLPGYPDFNYRILSRFEPGEEGLVEQIRFGYVPVWARSHFVATPTGVAYASFTGRRQTSLVAFGEDGGVRWVRTIDWLPGETLSSTLRLDDAGRVYWLLQLDPTNPRDRLVDVVSPQGEVLARAKIDNFAARAWDRTHGDFTYGANVDQETLEWQVVRARLTLPF